MEYRKRAPNKYYEDQDKYLRLNNASQNFYFSFKNYNNIIKYK